MTRLAYVIGTFPALTETFVVREVQALEAAGVAVELFSLRRPAPAHAQADGADLASRTVYGSGVFALAVAFAERMREREVAHVHARWATYPATAAYDLPPARRHLQLHRPRLRRLADPLAHAGKDPPGRVRDDVHRLEPGLAPAVCPRGAGAGLPQLPRRGPRSLCAPAPG
jgi:hypothetical protein